MKRWIHIADQWTETERKEMMAYLRTFGDNKTTTEGKLKDYVKEQTTPITKEMLYWLFDEARKDIVPGDEFWFDWAKTSQEHDEQLTKDYKNLLLKLLKWFGEEKKNE